MTVGSKKKRLLIIDDDPGICDFVARVAQKEGFETVSECGVVEVLTLVQQFQPNVIILDLQMPHADGIELLRVLADAGCKSEILLMSGMDRRTVATAEVLGSARGLKMSGFLRKPVAVSELRRRLRIAMDAQRIITSDDLRKAIDDGELIFYYQPKATWVPGKGWVVDELEALVRWLHPDFGLVLPNEFIPLADESGLVRPMTEYLLCVAAEQVKAWRALGREVAVSVNVSPKLLNDMAFPDKLADLVRSYDVDCSSLVLEVTESAAMGAPEVTMDILTRLRLKGFTLAMDDFGVGYSSLRQLFKLPFCELKIDKSFIIELEGSEEARTIVSAMVTMAHQLGMTVCAEGVESEGSLKLLESFGCDKVQGYLISRPVPPSQVFLSCERWMGGADRTQKAEPALRVLK